MQGFRSLQRRNQPEAQSPTALLRFAVNRVQLETAAGRDALADVRSSIRAGATREEAMQKLIDIREQTLSALGEFAESFGKTLDDADASTEKLDAELESLSARFRADVERVKGELERKLSATETEG